MTPPQPVDQPEEIDHRPARLGALAIALQVHQFGADLEDDDTLLRVTTERRPNYALEVRCDRRAVDGGRLWFTGPDGMPLAEADDITAALMAIKGMTAVRM